MTHLIIGTYAKPGGQGLYPLSVSTDGALALGQCAAPARNASFGAWSAAHRLHFLVDECDSRVATWTSEGGRWRCLSSLPSGGKEPCYLALDERGGRLAVANYASGTLALFALGTDGLPLEPPATFADSGSGPVEGRQDGPHLHCVRFGPDRQSLYAVDLGADQVLRIKLDGARLGDCAVAYKAPPGSGPRHLLFHPTRPFALLVSELASALTLLAVSGDKLVALATCATTPSGWSGENLGGHLQWPSTERAYVTNRGHDSVTLIDVDLDDPRLAIRRDVPSGGKSPRHFLIVEELDLMVVAHEKDGTVASFLIEGDGSLTPTGNAVQVPGACYVFRA